MLNPILFTERVVRDFLKYQLTTYPFADQDFHAQLRELLNLDHTRQSPLMKGPYASLSRPFRQGPPVADLCSEGVLHRHVQNLVYHPNVYGHQEAAIRHIVSGKTTLVSTGTGSGKTESFLYPLISHCLKLRDEGAPAGIVAVLVYPMNALAEDQLERLRSLLVGSGVTFGMYIGKTPERPADVTGKRLQVNSRAAHEAAVRQREQEREQRRGHGSYAIHPAEERCSREEIRAQPPRLLLTNVKQLELLLTRQRDIEMFNGAQMQFIVFDEAHTFKGAQGAETACLIRRLRSFCGRTPEQITCVAASATMVAGDGGENAGKEFASRFFGVPPQNVEVVTEQYVEEEWNSTRAVPNEFSLPPREALQNALSVLGEDEAQMPMVLQEITGAVFHENWQEELYANLSGNDLLYRLVQGLRQPRLLSELRDELQGDLSRELSEEEILLWLALGSAARSAGRPLVRPVLHVFVRGVGGAVVTFPPNAQRPRLWLSAEESRSIAEGDETLFPLPVKTCNTCGQHYFTHELADFQFTEELPGGGERHGERTIWRPLPKKDGGFRITFVDRLVSEEDDEPARTGPVFLCRYCGTVHAEDGNDCVGCGRSSALVRLLAVQQRERRPHNLTSCLACGSRGGDRPGIYREPARPVRAVTVSDVHVLGQNMIMHGHEDRLLIFADNRQDAAFQAGWMRDHARRFRIRALMLERLSQGPVTIGDLAAALDQRLEADRGLSEAVIPEVWRIFSADAEPTKHAEERRHFLRILVLREAVTGVRQRVGLEPWGRMRVDYAGLDPNLPFFQRWSAAAELTSEELYHGVASLIDSERRKMVVWDERTRLFSKFWNEGERDILRGYIPDMKGVPKGLKLFREAGDGEARINQWWSNRGLTMARQCIRNWGFQAEQALPFIEDLWRFLRNDLGILVEVQLRGGGPNGAVIRGTSGSCQFDSGKFLLVPQQSHWECKTCRRLHSRATPGMICMGWHCGGTIVSKPGDPDNYDLAIVAHQVNNESRMLKPREHSAQVPVDERERLERMFKDPKNTQVNTLVCTPTLELGVDIGALDSVLMRNVPPLPANYWQRAGRAGRRHRMAVNITYARPASHDRAFFAAPLKLLSGAITPPRFNLRNAELVRKHAHATVLTVLHTLARESSGLPVDLRAQIAGALDRCFPAQVRSYLFDEGGNVRQAPLEVEEFAAVLACHRAAVFDGLIRALTASWPEAEADCVKEPALGEIVDEMAARLREVILRLWQRLQWALNQKAQLREIERKKGNLNEEETALLRRCDRLIRRLKGETKRNSAQAEGVDDSNTYAVLALEGFLPGYGLDRGSIMGTAEMPRGLPGPAEYLLPRASVLALREYVPGNLIYANGHRFVPRLFHLEARDPVSFHINLANEAITEASTLNAQSTLAAGFSLKAVAVCDVDLPHHWHIHDEEDHRFQLGVMILGHEGSAAPHPRKLLERIAEPLRSEPITDLNRWPAMSARATKKAAWKTESDTSKRISQWTANPLLRVGQFCFLGQLAILVPAPENPMKLTGTIAASESLWRGQSTTGGFTSHASRKLPGEENPSANQHHRPPHEQGHDAFGHLREQHFG